VIRVAIVTISDSAVAGTRADASGPALESLAKELGWEVKEKHVLPDDREKIGSLLSNLGRSDGLDLIVTTGGTGLGPRDRTPEATRGIAEREVPGFGELMRAEGRKSNKFADLSRSTAFTLEAALILNLPGSPKGAVDSLKAVSGLIPHAVDLLHGRTEHKAERKP
jgi:molybdenum cofactor synthesis domain-containing protein